MKLYTNTSEIEHDISKDLGNVDISTLDASLRYNAYVSRVLDSNNDFGFIRSFRGDYRFLSNFYKSKIEVMGYVFPTVEHGYVAFKSKNPRDMLNTIKDMTAGQAKRYGRTISICDEFNTGKDELMLILVTAKFKQNPHLAQLLKNTGDMYIIEGNHWGDKYWGICEKSGEGFNKLGNMLMSVRSNLLSQ